jgi:hypothetical protein|nr:hypothetical protein NG677_19800 [Methylobacterium sp. OTU13CASTA1]
MAEHDWKAKIAAAQDAVEKAAALLLEHAEGLGALAMMERHREKPVDLHEASLTPSLYLRDDGASWEHLAASPRSIKLWGQATANRPDGHAASYGTWSRHSEWLTGGRSKFLTPSR